jgi:hypothetical protein
LFLRAERMERKRMTDYIIILLLVMIWLQGTKYPDMIAYKIRRVVKHIKQRRRAKRK